MSIADCLKALRDLVGGCFVQRQRPSNRVVKPPVLGNGSAGQETPQPIEMIVSADPVSTASMPFG